MPGRGLSEPMSAECSLEIERPAAAAAAPRKSRWLHLAGSFAGLGVAAFAFYSLKIEPRRFLGSLASMPWWMFAGCVGSGVLLLLAQSLRWHLVIRSLFGLRYAQALQAVIVGTLFNAVIPARGGDVVRAQFLGDRTGSSRPTLIGTLVVDRWLDMSGWVVAVVVVALTCRLPAWVTSASVALAGLLVAWGVVMVVLMRHRKAPKEGSRLAKMFQSFKLGIQCFRWSPTLVLAMLVAPFNWLWEALALRYAGHACGIELNYSKAFSVLIGLNLATVVPSPASVGSVETGGTAALASFGVDHSAALAFVTAYHMSQLLPTIVLGVVVLVLGSLRRRVPAAAAV